MVRSLLSLTTSRQLKNGSHEAVKRANSEPGTNRRSEGQLNRLKTLKRSMYGRGGSSVSEPPLRPDPAIHRSRRDPRQGAGEQLLFAEQPGVLERLQVREVQSMSKPKCDRNCLVVT
jgi:hypothetical protein